MKKIVFSTYCHDEFKDRFGFYKCINSLKYFHPDIEIIPYGSTEINRVYQEYDVNLSNALPCLILDIKKKTGAEYVCHIDADSLCFGRLNEILECDYDITSCRNNCDFHTGDERQNRPKCLWDLPNEMFVNCGLTSTNSEKFLLEWIDLNKQITEKYGKITTFWQSDIQWFNYLFHYGGYKSKILDEKDGSLFYGPSANMYSPYDHKVPESITKEYGGEFKGWNSWLDIEYKNEKFWLYERECKLIHAAGGGSWKNSNKLDWDRFNPEIIPILKKITNESN